MIQPAYGGSIDVHFDLKFYMGKGYLDIYYDWVNPANGQIRSVNQILGISRIKHFSDYSTPQFRCSFCKNGRYNIYFYLGPYFKCSFCFGFRRDLKGTGFKVSKLCQMIDKAKTPGRKLQALNYLVSGREQLRRKLSRT